MGYAISVAVVLLAVVAAFSNTEPSAWVDAMDPPTTTTRAVVPTSLKDTLLMIGGLLVIGLFALIAVGLLFKLLTWLF